MDIGASNWNENDTNNNQPAPDGAPEGMFPSGVNDTIRAVMGALKRWFNWSSPRTTNGSATAYTLSYGVAPGALVDGMTHLVQFHAGNGPGATLNVNNLGAKPLYAYSGGGWYQAPAALFDVATVCRVAYDAATGAYRLLMPRVVPTGTVVPFAGAVAPAGYLLAFGQAVSRTNYAGLFAVLGGTYGGGDGSTTFNVPDLRGRVAAGRDDMGGFLSGRLDGAVPRTALGGAFGEQYHTLSGAEMPTHNHGISDSGHSHTLPNGRAVNGGTGDNFFVAYDPGSMTPPAPTGLSGTGISIQNAGANGAHNNMQPTIILNHIIAI